MDLTRQRNRQSSVWQRGGHRLLPLLLALILFGGVPATPVLATNDSPASPIAEWVEPKGINIVDLVGQVPEETLRDAILVDSGVGIVQYQSGVRVGDTVTITVKITPRYSVRPNITYSYFACLGQPGTFDQWPSIMPTAKMRLYEGGVDITDKVFWLSVIPAGFQHPSRATTVGDRYDKVTIDPPNRDPDGSVIIPANMGCEILAPGELRNLTATFTFVSPPLVEVLPLGSQSFTYRTYIGIGAAGQLESLRSQMLARFGPRHDKFDLIPPLGTEFVFVKYPPAAANAGASESIAVNVRNPTGGTYRLGNANIGAPGLSVDHFNSMGLSFNGQWHDSDANPSSPYLTFFDNPYFLSGPEVFIPDSIPYDPCMTNGGCSPALLQAIYDATMPITITYLKVTQSACTADSYTYRPLRMVGAAWTPGSLTSATANTAYRFPTWASPLVPGDDPLDKFIYLPIAFRSPEVCTPVTPPPLADCPCGVFAADGRMVDFIR